MLTYFMVCFLTSCFRKQCNILCGVFFRLNGVEFSFADVLFITSVLTICIIILVVTICFCLTSTTRNYVRYFYHFFQTFKIQCHTSWPILIGRFRYFRKISLNENLSSLMRSSQENSKSFTTSWVRILHSALILMGFFLVSWFFVVFFFCKYLYI